MRVLILIFLLSFSQLSWPLTVHDPVAFVIHTLNRMENQLSKIQQRAANHTLVIQAKRQLETIQQLKSQFELMERQLDTMQGTSGYGRYLDGTFKSMDAKYSPQSLDQLMNIMRNIDQENGPAVKLLRDILKSNPYYQSEHKPSNPNDTIEKNRANLRRNTSAMRYQSDLSYETASDSYDRLRLMQLEIDNASTLKKTMDLNTRIMTELGYLFAASIKNNSVSSKLTAEEVKSKVDKEEKERNFNRIQQRKYKIY